MLHRELLNMIVILFKKVRMIFLSPNHRLLIVQFIGYTQVSLGLLNADARREQGPSTSGVQIPGYLSVIDKSSTKVVPCKAIYTSACSLHRLVFLDLFD